MMNDQTWKLTMRAVKNGESEQNTDVLVGALIPKASVPIRCSLTLSGYPCTKVPLPVAMTTRRCPRRYKLKSYISKFSMTY